MKLRYLGFLFLSAVLFGCAAEGPAYETVPVAQAKSAVYLYRPYSAVPAVTLLALTPPVGIIDCGNFSVHLKLGAYRRFLVDPGPVRCAISSETTSRVDFTAEPGRNYYIRETMHSGFLGPHYQIEYVTPEDAKNEIADCKEQQPP